MRICATVFGSLLLLFAATPLVFADDEKKDSPEEPKEVAVVDYDSKTHGALEVRTIFKRTGDWFDVLKDGKRAVPGAPSLLNNTHKLEPGTYVAVVNKTQRTVTIEAGKKTILLTGELVVEGKPDTAYWFPMQGDEQKVASVQPLFNRPLHLLPGKYDVFTVVSTIDGAKGKGQAEVKAGKRTVVKH